MSLTADTDTSTVPKTLPLLRGKSIDLETALASDDNVLRELAYPELELDFFGHIYRHRHDIEGLVAQHLGLNRVSCQMAETGWLRGSFNGCIPVNIGDPRYPAKRVMFRFPLPYKVGEKQYPGNAEEKLRCELATYIWMRQHCPTVPIPSLLGFGFASGLSFVLPRAVPFFHRMIWHVKRFLSWAFRRRPLPCAYVSQRYTQTLGLGYMILEHIEEDKGKLLSYSWHDQPHDNARKANLFRDISRIMLSLARHPFPHIGSLTIDNEGTLCFTNRPLTLRLQHLENEGIPSNIDRSRTYHTSDAYILDLLACYNHKLRHQPNSILDDSDGRSQLAAITILQAIYSHYLQHNLRHGPFIFMLTDLHHSNIFVDDDWNITCIIDLEWACSQPVEMLRVPSWLSNHPVDFLLPGDGGHLQEFSKLHDEFLEIFEKNEKEMEVDSNKSLFLHSLTNIMKTGWENGSYWFFYALENPKGLFNLFIIHLLPRYRDPNANFEDVVHSFWGVDANQFIEAKLKEKEEYDAELRKAFAENTENKPSLR